MVRELLWGSRFRVHHRVADSYRAGRVLLAGDAAHVHSPAGGQGMNAGILDAIGLADALVEALAGDAAALDAYGDRSAARWRSRWWRFADRLTRLATAPRALRGAAQPAAVAAGAAAAVRNQLAWRLSGLVYR